jgi:hypothetical protein
VHKTGTNPAVLLSGSCEIFLATFKIKHKILKHEFSVNKLGTNHRARKFHPVPSVVFPPTTLSLLFLLLVYNMDSDWT